MPAMFQLLEVAPDGKCDVYGALSADAIRPCATGHWRWFDLIGPTAEELSLLQERFGFHPVAIKDCAEYDHRPKLEPYDDYLFVVIHTLRPLEGSSQDLEASELHAFLGPNYLVTVHDGNIGLIEAAFRRLTQEPQHAKRGPAFAYYLLADMALSSLFPWIEELIERIENVEEVLLESPSQAAIADAYQTRRLLASMRRVLAPQREVFASLLKLESALIGKKTLPFFRSVHDDVLRLTELVEAAREHIANLREAYASALSQRTNAVVQRLTVLSAIFLPLTFITGFFGQNFEALPFSSKELFYFAVSVTTCVPIGMFIWFRSRGWW